MLILIFDPFCFSFLFKGTQKFSPNHCGYDYCSLLILGYDAITLSIVYSVFLVKFTRNMVKRRH